MGKNYAKREDIKLLNKKEKVQKKCQNCLGEFYIHQCYKDSAKFCSVRCFNTWQKNNPKLMGTNSVHWKGGKPKCQDCGDRLPNRHSKKRQTSRCRECFRKNYKSEDSPNWKVGITPLK